MVDFSSVPNAPLKIVFMIHFILTTWGVQGTWSPDSYFFYNIIFFVVLIWAIHNNESMEPIQMATVISASLVLLDILVLIIYFPNSYYSSERFSVGMAIMNLVIRPVTTLVLYRVYTDRTGGPVLTSPFPNNFGEIFSGAGGQRTYEDIDNHQSVPPHGDQSSPTLFSPNDNKMPPPYHG